MAHERGRIGQMNQRYSAQTYPDEPVDPIAAAAAEIISLHSYVFASDLVVAGRYESDAGHDRCDSLADVQVTTADRSVDALADSD
jgi:hypothetical protein